MDQSALHTAQEIASLAARMHNEAEAIAQYISKHSAQASVITTFAGPLSIIRERLRELHKELCSI